MRDGINAGRDFVDGKIELESWQVRIIGSAKLNMDSRTCDYTPKLKRI